MTLHLKHLEQQGHVSWTRDFPILQEFIWTLPNHDTNLIPILRFLLQ